MTSGEPDVEPRNRHPLSCSRVTCRIALAVVQLAAGANHACALRADGSIACWGNNDYGQIGDGTKTTRFSPVTVGAW